MARLNVQQQPHVTAAVDVWNATGDPVATAIAAVVWSHDATIDLPQYLREVAAALDVDEAVQNDVMAPADVLRAYLGSFRWQEDGTQASDDVRRRMYEALDTLEGRCGG